jgi:hypothetical protein
LLRIWDARSGALVARLRRHEQGLTSLRDSTDGTWIVSGSYDHTVRLWDTVERRQLCCLRGFPASVSGVTLSANGQWIVSWTEHFGVCVWDARSGTLVQSVKCRRADVDGVAAALRGGFRAVARGPETVIEDGQSGAPRAWFPVAFHRALATHPGGRMWAGAEGSHLYLVALEMIPPTSMATC